MASRKWDRNEAERRIDTRMAEVEEVTIKEYARETDLTGLPTGTAYRVDGVHLYIDILNIDEMLDSGGVRAHRRTLRFLNLHYRAVRNILLDVEAIQVDFHNQRLHAVFAKPYGDEVARIHKAVATAKLICDVLARTGEDSDDPLPAAQVRVGIDSGKALAVTNGRRGSREPLFLGEPANLAAKLSGGGTATGIYMTNSARSTVEWASVKDEKATKLSDKQVEESQDKANLGITVDDVIADWEGDLDKNPIGSFDFTRHTPPFGSLDLDLLSPKNSRRQEATSIYADIDGFTKYVAERIEDDESAKDVVRTLHVLRAELDSVLYNDFAGLKIRFIGDCVHGILVEGTAHTTDDDETAKNAMLCAAAMRSSFELAMETLAEEGVDAGNLGLAIGLEHGFLAVTRLGIKGEMIRCCISRSVLSSEDEQLRCDGSETAIGPELNKSAPDAFKELFGEERIRSGFDYDEATLSLEKKTKASTARTEGNLLRPATVATAVASTATAGFSFPSQAASPSKIPPGFA
ncbi:transcriptional regulator [Chromobacterium sp. Panama]|uniref:adenylate/guanylate cyclase domain-containing protein n=1 Tax=Chromobacterium sp. Panama TaxID=2161826 RepID=UPI000D30A441|nr:adenylate/guanylate cyclase domain-containing protein [Chromobacterium sp. Panama]PTU66977.1 transcriptional regulator [Chromobacterium sp. Panama]